MRPVFFSVICFLGLCAAWPLLPACAQQPDCGTRCGQTILQDQSACIAGERYQCNDGRLTLQGQRCSNDPCQSSAEHALSPAFIRSLYAQPDTLVPQTVPSRASNREKKTVYPSDSAEPQEKNWPDFDDFGE